MNKSPASAGLFHGRPVGARALPHAVEGPFCRSWKKKKNFLDQRVDMPARIRKMARL